MACQEEDLQLGAPSVAIDATLALSALSLEESASRREVVESYCLCYSLNNFLELADMIEIICSQVVGSKLSTLRIPPFSAFGTVVKKSSNT